MDHEAFDRIVRMLGAAGSRRAAVAALLGSGTLGAVGSALGKKKRKPRAGNTQRDKHKSKGRKKTRDKIRRPENPAQAAPAPEEDAVTAEAADCLNPAPSSNMNGCNFSGEDFDGFDLSSSSMKKTNFSNASLCRADLSSSQLKEADFRDANLTKADLHSSGCAGIKTNAATVFCNTIMCNGNTNDSDCPVGQICCDTDDCAERVCQTVQCQSPACVYSDQPDGQPGNQCPAPRQCCDGGCCDEERKCCGDTCIFRPSCCTNGQEGCPDGQKCCGGACIAETRCCTNNVPDFCADDTRCCGGECILPNECCTNNSPGCPPEQTCLDTSETEGPTCCPNANVCGLRCRFEPCDASECRVCDHSQSICVSTCGPTQLCCLSEGGICKQDNGQSCQSADDCCGATVCGGNPQRCCRPAGALCTTGDDALCCSGVCDLDESECT